MAGSIAVTTDYPANWLFAMQPEQTKLLTRPEELMDFTATVKACLRPVGHGTDEVVAVVGEAQPQSGDYHVHSPGFCIS